MTATSDSDATHTSLLAWPEPVPESTRHARHHSAGRQPAHYSEAVTVEKVAADIGPGLAKAALAGKVDGKLVDTSHLDRPRRAGSRSSRTEDPEGLEVIRHSTAHLLAQAVKQLYPDAQVTIGPVIEDGFYYDFAYKRPFTPEDLAAIEERMRELVARPTTRSHAA